MQKIAFLSYKPISKLQSGYDLIYTTSASILKKDNTVKFFSVGNKNIVEQFDDGVYQHIYKGFSFPENLGLLKIIDLIALTIFGIRPSINLINKNDYFFKKLNEYKPDIIILPGAAYYLFKIAIKFKNKNPQSKLIIYTDSPIEMFQNSFNSIKNSPLPYFLINYMNKRYLKYNLNIFKKLFLISDYIVTFTREDKIKIKSDFKLSKKIFVIPSVYIKKEPKLKLTKIKKIKKIMFIGACGYPANDEIIKIIKNNIAPQLETKQFIIVGKNCKNQDINNVKIIGSASEKKLDSLLKTADICIAPLFNGGGIKTKILKYLSYYKPVIGTSIAFRGYPIKNRINAIVENDIEKYPILIQEFEKNIKLYNKIQKNIKYVLNFFSEKTIRKKWVKLMKT